MTDRARPTIAVLGASGLIGEAVTAWLAQDGFPIVPIARRFSPVQKITFGKSAVECPIVLLDAASLAQIFAENSIDIVVNCVGVLQDRWRGNTDAAHRLLVDRLVAILGASDRPTLLIHLSIPGKSKGDRTFFSRTKREAENAITSGSVPFIILRPGFVVAPAAYGGSALMRALAALPFDLPARETRQPFATTDVTDIARTIAIVARRWSAGERSWNAIWEVMAREPTTVADVLDAFRRRSGRLAKGWPLPSWLVELGARTGDFIAHLGWQPAIRSTALQELRRGVAGDPQPWTMATGIEPASLDSTLQRLPATVQEKWFACLYLTKALVLASLVIFWVVSGVIALTIAFTAATAVLTSHGFPVMVAKAVTVASSLADIAIGLAIAFHRTCRAGLLAGICLSLFYMAGATVMTPDLWVEPLGALVKTGPTIVLMLVALAMLENR